MCVYIYIYIYMYTHTHLSLSLCIYIYIYIYVLGDTKSWPIGKRAASAKPLCKTSVFWLTKCLTANLRNY